MGPRRRRTTGFAPMEETESSFSFSLCKEKGPKESEEAVGPLSLLPQGPDRLHVSRFAREAMAVGQPDIFSPLKNSSMRLRFFG